MTLRRPAPSDLIDISERYHLRLTEAEVDDFHEIVKGVMDGYATVLRAAHAYQSAAA